MNLDISVLGFIPNGGKGNWNCNVLFSKYQNDFNLEMSNVTYQVKYFVTSEADEKASLVSSH